MSLRAVAARTPTLAVACNRCERAEGYRLTALIARYGKSFSIPELLSLLSADCPKRGSVTAYDVCGIHCPDLPALFTANVCHRPRPSSGR
jgi:hypothetical protein